MIKNKVIILEQVPLEDELPPLDKEHLLTFVKGIGFVSAIQVKTRIGFKFISSDTRVGIVPKYWFRELSLDDVCNCNLNFVSGIMLFLLGIITGFILTMTYNYKQDSKDYRLIGKEQNSIVCVEYRNKYTGEVSQQECYETDSYSYYHAVVGNYYDKFSLPKIN